MAESDLLRGIIDPIILNVLYEGDRYGYDLVKQINAKSNGQWEVKQPTVYACLKRLEKQGFIASYWDPTESEGGRRRYYTLTDSGREVFVKRKGEYERASALYGGLIGLDQTPSLKPAADEWDVEEEGYSVPKRRPAKKRVSPAPITPPEQAEAEQSEPVQAEEEYIQGTLFDESASRPDGDGSHILGEDEKPTGASPAPAEPTAPQNNNVVAENTDPRSIIENYYADSGESYADARDRLNYAQQPARPAPPVEPAPEPTPAPEPPAEPTAPAPAPQPPPPVSPLFDDDESPARRDYKTVLSDLVKRFEVATPDNRPVMRESSEQAATDAEEGVSEPFFKIRQAALELGNDVTVRSHNDSAKQYTQKFYYYSNKLRVTHYIIMCSAMFLVGLMLGLIFYAGMGKRMRYDGLLYTITGLLPIIMFIISVGMYANNVDKKRRIDVNFKLSLTLRIVFMIQVDVVVYCLNLIWGMPISFSAGYIPSLVIPAVYATFIPISHVIFMTLLKTKHYAVE